MAKNSKNLESHSEFTCIQIKNITRLEGTTKNLEKEISRIVEELKETKEKISLNENKIYEIINENRAMFENQQSSLNKLAVDIKNIYEFKKWLGTQFWKLLFFIITTLIGIIMMYMFSKYIENEKIQYDKHIYKIVNDAQKMHYNTNSKFLKYKKPNIE